jgi:putative polymerase
VNLGRGSYSDARIGEKAYLDAPSLIVLLAATFNALLAILNAHIAPISSGAAILGEICLLIASHFYALQRYRPEMATWYTLLGLLLIGFLARTLATGEIEPKYLRDTAIIPTFIVLGLAADRRCLDRTVFILLAIVTIVAVIETLFPNTYTEIFNVLEYYISSRDYAAEDFYTKDSALYVSAVRPDERVFSFLDMPRISSIFLEPVSLGNYCTIMTAYFCARFSQLSSIAVLSGAAAITFLLVGCDGRLAVVSIFLIIAVSILAPTPPRSSAAVYLPLVIAGMVVVTLAMNPNPEADDFPGRIAYSIHLLSQFHLDHWLGIHRNQDDLDSGIAFFDSGIGYLVATQSIICLAVIWLFLACIGEEKTREQIRYTHAILLYFALTLTVSYSMLTIKTAALAWFIYGVFQQARSVVGTIPGEGDSDCIPTPRFVRR